MADPSPTVPPAPPPASPSPSAGLPVEALALAARQRRHVRVAGLQACAPALLLAGAAPPGPVLWVAPTAEEAARVQTELSVLLGSDAVVPLPAWDVAPYKGYSPSAQCTRARLAALVRLVTHTPGAPLVVVAPAPAVLKRVLPARRLRAATERVAVGEDIDRPALLRRLVERGWLSTDLCSETGTFAVRGHILDVFPPGRSTPLRIELWGDEVDSIRAFDPWTQRSIGSVQEAWLPPVREEILDSLALEALPTELKRLSDERGLAPGRRIALTRELADSTIVPELELYLPVLHGSLETIFDHLGPEGLVVWQGPAGIAAATDGEFEQVRERWERQGGLDRLLPHPSDLFLDEPGLRAAFDGIGAVVLPELHDDTDTPIASRDHGGLRTEILASKDKDGMLEPLVKRLRAWRKDLWRVVLVADSPAQRRQLSALLDNYDVPIQRIPGNLDAATLLSEAGLPRGLIHLATADLPRGVELPSLRLAIVAGAEILGSRKRRKQARPPRGFEPIGSLAALNKDDRVVHAVHGIGAFQGLSKLMLDPSAAAIREDVRGRANDPSYRPGTGPKLGTGRGSNNDYLLLEYRGGDRLYLPVHKLNLLAKYVSPGGKAPQLDKLGGQSWANRRKKVSQEVQKIASELLDLYARRELARSHAYVEPGELYREFVAAFPYDETPDQAAAIDAILGDLAKPQPTDRLVCGDVGFGKTECAMRASFVVVEEGKQVAVLVPTTILALQHYEAFKARFAPFPVRVEMLSRFRTPGQVKKTIAACKRGEVDIVVGTHRLLSKDIGFKELGLLVVDEEHRFGVSHKERIKQMRAGVDVLTMTATPIPRTLHMALSGIRDFSIIATPPEGRLPVHTAVARHSHKRIVEAIQDEIGRGGQVFYLHNRVQTIWAEAEQLTRMIPSITLRVAHGQMSERELEDIMLGFFQGDFDVLLSTTIIESGIDVPRANTMIIDHAHRFGLAQLHQLRGRVGRSHLRGFCLLLVPPETSMSSVAVERLRVIQDHTELGSGHRIAQRDLELRGAGNLLGSKQSGHIASVGLATYTELLESAVKRLQGKASVAGLDPDIDLRTDAYIPGDYVPDEAERLMEYKRLADCRSMDELRQTFADLEDRYGKPPAEVAAFEQLIELKVRASQLRLISLRMVRGGRLQLTFDAATRVDPVALMTMVRADTRKYHFKPEGVLQISLEPEQRRSPVEAAMAVCAELAVHVREDGAHELEAAIERARLADPDSEPPGAPEQHPESRAAQAVRGRLVTHREPALPAAHRAVRKARRTLSDPPDRKGGG